MTVEKDNSYAENINGYGDYYDGDLVKLDYEIYGIVSSFITFFLESICYLNYFFPDEERLKKKEEIEAFLLKNSFDDGFADKLREFAKSAGGLIDGWFDS